MSAPEPVLPPPEAPHALGASRRPPVPGPPVAAVLTGSRRPAPATALGAVAVGFRRYSVSTGAVLGAAVVWLAVLALTGLSLFAAARGLGFVDSELVARTGRSMSRAVLTFEGRIFTATIGAVPATLALIACSSGGLRLVRTGAVRFADFFTVPRGVPTLAFIGLGAAVALVGALTFGGGAAAGLVFIFAGPAFVDSPRSALGAYRTSALLVGSRFWQTLLLAVLASVIAAGGFLVFLVGALWTLPAAGLAVVALYCGLRREMITA
ncbi:hypothetical protein C8046_00830 [Serinibacter arcticus]|uniref:Integral membrane protein n=1 Tax=Serinibacter arcticus TaxID=1655435 RepID=A0A2U1ZR62_9MICO|nr:hypothetical protein [Serinibacter arcticus]PWD49479.1 hypothetical protein C8046_00830 [Serinibacter arcticus]